ncbi:MAG: Integral rane protein [Frankiales bacterium]|jgi:hypothetical protein|nr:Integral rane protein [Frankiales bacterium]
MFKDEVWRFFAAAMLGLAGILRIFDAVWAFAYNGTLPSNLEGALFGHSLNTYGWVYLIVGIILIVSSIAVVMGSDAGRWIGIIAAAIGAISAIWWMPYYPVWSLTYIGISALVIYGLVAYGGREAYDAAKTA